MSNARQGDTVKVHFTGKTADGNVFATSYGQAPLEFTIGEGFMLPGIEKAVQGMKIGEQKVTKVTPEDAYGPHNPEWVFDIERTEFPNNFVPEIGMQLQVPQPDGMFVMLTVLSIEEKTVKVDANHPLAGENLTFELELVDID